MTQNVGNFRDDAESLAVAVTNPFDSIRRHSETGAEYWLARELMRLLGYVKWQKFEDAIERAKIACENAGNSVSSHITASGNVVKRAQGGGNSRQDYRLTRYACYLIAMNGDPRKPEIAMAQSYFATKTREAETVIPQQNDRIKELQLEVELAKQQNRGRELDSSLVTLHGSAVALALRGVGGVVVEMEKPTIEVIADRVAFRGQTLTQVVDHLKKRHGIRNFKSGADLKRFLEKLGKDGLIAQTPRSVLQDYVPAENEQEVYQTILNCVDRQLPMGYQFGS